MEDLKCQMPDNNPLDEDIKKVLQRSRKIAVVGLSPKEERDSNKVARYLIEQGYEIVPVNPGQKEILGRECFPSLKDIPFPVDVADLFLNPKRIVRAAIIIKPSTLDSNRSGEQAQGLSGLLQRASMPCWTGWRHSS